jgi:prepilin signal peptidase PulO-like enzyme (type II secretory pathway)
MSLHHVVSLLSLYRVDWFAVGLAAAGAAVGLACALLADWVAFLLVREAFETRLQSAGSSTFWLGMEETAPVESIWSPVGGGGPGALFVFAIALAGAALGAGTAMRFGWSATTGCALLFCAAILLLTAIDLRQLLLPDALTLTLLWAGLLVNASHRFTSLPSAVFGAVAGYLTLWIVCAAGQAFKLKAGLGFGDLKLYAAAGAWLGLAAMPQVFAISLVTAAICMVVARVTAPESIDRLHAMGPYIAVAAAATLLGVRWIIVPVLEVPAALLHMV